jgi:hypothetical protein
MSEEYRACLNEVAERVIAEMPDDEIVDEREVKLKTPFEIFETFLDDEWQTALSENRNEVKENIPKMLAGRTIAEYVAEIQCPVQKFLPTKGVYVISGNIRSVQREFAIFSLSIKPI